MAVALSKVKFKSSIGDLPGFLSMVASHSLAA